MPQIEVDTLHADIRGEYSDVDAPSSLVVILEALSSMYGCHNLFSSYARLETLTIKDSSVSVFSKCRHDCAPKWANEMTWRAARARLVEKLKASKDSVGNGPVVWICHSRISRTTRVHVPIISSNSELAKVLKALFVRHVCHVCHCR